MSLITSRLFWKAYDVIVGLPKESVSKDRNDEDVDDERD